MTSKKYKKAENDPGTDQKPPDQEEDGTDKLELHSLEATNAKLKMIHASLSTAIDTLRNWLLTGGDSRHNVQIDLLTKKF